MGYKKKWNSIQVVGLVAVVWSIFASGPVFASAMVEVAEAPTSDLNLTLRAIRSARKTLQINAYELTSKVIAEAIRERIRAGVDVDILQEGEAVGGFPEDGVPIRRALVAAITAAQKGSYRLMVGRRNGVRRFPFDHAKYMIVDQASVLMGSENYSPTGHPEPNTVGNRGWEVFIHDAGIAADFGKVFGGDRDLRRRDVEEWAGFSKNLLDAMDLGRFFLSGGELLPAPPPDDQLVDEKGLPFSLTAVPALPAQRILPVASPDTSLSTLIALIRGARRSIDVQQMIFNPDWAEAVNGSPLMAELIFAARRGVRVRVLLNDDAAFGQDPGESKNLRTIEYLNSAAQRFRIGIEARTANVEQMGVGYIHNKGVLVDGQYVLVSSINWNQNSVERNRETGIVLQGVELNRYYSRLFESDWWVSRNTGQRRDVLAGELADGE
ncbi:MAG TPA: phospholipase D-like domain-containing protein [Bdellovibrionota bacterium]|nr:phospholipase D-like domain-containing protein [Bdellovibrionota bacterium]